MAITKISNSSLASLNRYDSMLAGNAAYKSGIFESIATITVDISGLYSVIFDNIPQNYSHLHFRGINRTTRPAGVNDSSVVRFNNDSGANYTEHDTMYLTGSGTGLANSAQATSQTQGYFALCGNNGGYLGPFLVDIMDYTSISKYKITKSHSMVDNAGNSAYQMGSSLWMSTAPITKVEIYSGTGYPFTQYSTFALYGIRS